MRWIQLSSQKLPVARFAKPMLSCLRKWSEAVSDPENLPPNHWKDFIPMRKPLITTMSLLAAGLFVAGCSTAPRTQVARENLHDQVVAELNTYKRTDPGLRNLLHRAAGYAMFPDVGKGGFIVGAAYGHGEVFRHGHSIGWADMTVASVGAQIGAQGYSELIVFENEAALDRFKNNNFTFGANVSAVAVTAGAAAGAKFNNGVAVFVRTGAGLMAEASLSGQRFTFRPRGEMNNQNNNYNNNENNENNNNNNNE